MSDHEKNQKLPKNSKAFLRSHSVVKSVLFARFLLLNLWDAFWNFDVLQA